MKGTARLTLIIGGAIIPLLFGVLVCPNPSLGEFPCALLLF